MTQTPASQVNNGPGASVTQPSARLAPPPPPPPLALALAPAPNCHAPFTQPQSGPGDAPVQAVVVDVVDAVDVDEVLAVVPAAGALAVEDAGGAPPPCGLDVVVIGIGASTTTSGVMLARR